MKVPEYATQHRLRSMEISNPANLPTSAISIAAWVKIPTSRPSGAMVIVAKGGGGITDSFVLYQNTSFGSFGAVFSFEFVGGSSGGVGGPLIPEDGQWHHVAGTWASGSPARIYLDGVLVASSSSAFSGMIRYNSSFPISIGADFDPGPGLGWHGHIDDVRIYGHALSDAEVQELVRGNQPPLATDDFYGMNQSSSLSVPSPGVLANDSDPDEDAADGQNWSRARDTPPRSNSTRTARSPTRPRRTSTAKTPSPTGRTTAPPIRRSPPSTSR